MTVIIIIIKKFEKLIPYIYWLLLYLTLFSKNLNFIYIFDLYIYLKLFTVFRHPMLLPFSFYFNLI